jgi:hypothetical protein
MKHVIGIGLLVAGAFLFKWWIHPNFFIAHATGHVLEGTAISYRHLPVVFSHRSSLDLGSRFGFYFYPPVSDGPRAIRAIFADETVG